MPDCIGWKPSCFPMEIVAGPDLPAGDPRTGSQGHNHRHFPGEGGLVQNKFGEVQGSLAEGLGSVESRSSQYSLLLLTRAQENESIQGDEGRIH